MVELEIDKEDDHDSTIPTKNDYENIEDLTANKTLILSDMCKEEKYYCFCLQEIHNLSTLKIAGMTLVDKRPHRAIIKML